MDADITAVIAIPEEHRMEQLQLAYVSAVSAAGGASFDPPRQDYGIDGRLTEIRRLPDGSYAASNRLLNCQLKATTNFSKREDSIAYEMDIRAYNKFVTADGDTPRILIVFCLPKEWKHWLSISEEELVLKHCCYWIALSGEPSENVSSITIRIPRTHIFNPEAIRDIFELLRSGEDLNGPQS